MSKSAPTRAVLTDIEGTTTSLSFVKDVLFPHAQKELPRWVRAHADEPRVRAALEAVCAASDGPVAPGDVEGAIAQLEAWMKEDRKVTPLKTLQGYVWAEGYGRGAFVGHVYDDAVAQLRAWRQQGLRLAVYSSGSIEAQRLLFGHTGHGDLTPLFSSYFDTTSGAKAETASYERIAGALALAGRDVLFLSDVVAELDAARGAGMATVWLNRDGLSSTAMSHPEARSFATIDPVTLLGRAS